MRRASNSLHDIPIGSIMQGSTFKAEELFFRFNEKDTLESMWNVAQSKGRKISTIVQKEDDLSEKDKEGAYKKVAFNTFNISLE